MASFFSNFLHGLGAGDGAKDYRHASNLFTHDNFRLAPKFSFLYHCVIELGPAAQTYDPIELGLMVKSVDLPRISVQTSTIHAYNRKTINITGVDYQPISIIFHDDNFNTARNFLVDYYKYYFSDGGKSDGEYANYRSSSGLRAMMEENADVPGGSWGLDGIFVRNAGTNLIKNIKIYSLSKGRASEYILRNPVITDFSHGTHVASANDVMEHTITVAYEGLSYNDVSPSQVPGFGTGFYDRSKSSLGGGFLGPGGDLSNIISDLGKGNYLGAAVGAIQLREQLKAHSTKDFLRGSITSLIPTISNLTHVNVNNTFPTATLRKASQIRGVEAAAESGGSGRGRSFGTIATR